MSNKSISQSNVLNLYPAITVNQTKTAKLVDVSVPTIKKYINQGLLHPKIIGTNKLFDLDEVNALVRPRNKHSKSIYLIADVGDYETFINQVKNDVLKSIQSEQTKSLNAELPTSR
ncbi:hypothetical protein WKK_05370 [Weissella koreensis KACC 15510]|uniref:helix-turn-helix domain-containing protein n=1 Tax=Weissella koreensis TaxID=165096 RepID=UPI0002175052|nr:helix-turn-helix domain-containing protein [Weissella koreensis]AEJ23945.1 hypothetical protein WKK_05370 [Weissella koreensis KACC 15510]